MHLDPLEDPSAWIQWGGIDFDCFSSCTHFHQGETPRQIHVVIWRCLHLPIEVFKIWWDEYSHLFLSPSPGVDLKAHWWYLCYHCYCCSCDMKVLEATHLVFTAAVTSEMWDESWCVFVHARSLVSERWMPSIKAFSRSLLHWLKSTAEKQVPDKVLGWCQVCRSLISFMLFIEGPEFLPALTIGLGNK